MVLLLLLLISSKWQPQTKVHEWSTIHKFVVHIPYLYKNTNFFSFNKIKPTRKRHISMVQNLCWCNKMQVQGATPHQIAENPKGWKNIHATKWTRHHVQYSIKIYKFIMIFSPHKKVKEKKPYMMLTISHYAPPLWYLLHGSPHQDTLKSILSTISPVMLRAFKSLCCIIKLSWAIMLGSVIAAKLKPIKYLYIVSNSFLWSFKATSMTCTQALFYQLKIES